MAVDFLASSLVVLTAPFLVSFLALSTDMPKKPNQTVLSNNYNPIYFGVLIPLANFKKKTAKITALSVLRGEMVNISRATWWRVHRNFYPRTFADHSKFVQTCALTPAGVGILFPF